MAGERAPARGTEAPKANTVANSDANPGSLTRRDRSRFGSEDPRARLARWSTPPDPRTTAAPSWDELRRNAEHGRHAPAVGWPHTASVAWSRTITLPVRALLVWLDWIARCPSRTLAVLALYALLTHVPAFGWLPWFY